MGEQGLSGLTEDLREDKTRTALEKAAYAAVHIRLLRLKHAGGCPRNFADCPTGWVKTEDAMCTPQEPYDGICGTFAASTPDSVKEELSWKCQASWPCVASCLKDLTGCPAGWAKSGGVCAAPATYDGICS